MPEKTVTAADQSSIAGSGGSHALRWRLYRASRVIAWQLRAMKGRWILGRHACLGGDVHKLIGGNVPILNLQKCRSDYLIEAWSHRSVRARTHLVAPYMWITMPAPDFRMDPAGTMLFSRFKKE